MTPDEIKAWRARLSLGEVGMAAYLGVPVTTLRKWENGTRRPDSAPLRLFGVLTLIEQQAPDLHQDLIMAAVTIDRSVPVRGRGRPAKIEVGPQGLPEWMRTPH